MAGIIYKDKDLMIVQNLYWKRQTSILVEDNGTHKIIIKRGFFQGCVLSTSLFNV